MSATEDYGPDDALNFDYMSGEDEFPHLKEHWRNVRKGGPKEKRLRKIISMIPDTRKDEMHAIRLSNIYVHVRSEDLYDAFEKIGPIGDFFRPTNTATMLPTQYCFIRYLDKGNAEKALEVMEGAVFGGFSTGGIWHEQKVYIQEARQDSFFTMDTGYITNEALDTPEVTEKFFDSSLPSNHYAMKRADAIRHNDETFNLKVTNIPPEITKEMLQDLFGAYGEIASIYVPMDLKTKRFRNFGFVRFMDKMAALRAWEELENVNLGVGTNINVLPSFVPTYYSMNESAEMYS